VAAPCRRSVAGRSKGPAHATTAATDVPEASTSDPFVPLRDHRRRWPCHAGGDGPPRRRRCGISVDFDAEWWRQDAAERVTGLGNISTQHILYI
jgi:hypothetical protein